MAGMWLVGRAGPDDLDPLRQRQMMSWLTSLGVEPANIALRAAVVRNGDGGFELHLTEYVLNDAGRKFLDLASDQVVTRPRVVPIADGSWPDWLTGLGNAPTAEGGPAKVSRGGLVLPAGR